MQLRCALATHEVSQCRLTVTDCRDDAADHEPQYHTSNVAQQKDEAQTERHGKTQASVETPGDMLA